MQDRVYGVESEYALIYHPGPDDRPRPTNLSLYRRFEAALRARVCSLPNAASPFRSKFGRFLENGCTFHYEANVDYEQGLIEMASPECRDPDTLLVYERAKDDLIAELADEVNRDLALAGFRGHVRVGKNNVDSAGHTFGSHENYWVEDSSPPRERALFACVWLLLWIPSAPALVLLLAAQLVVGLLFGLTAVGLVLFALILGPLHPPSARRLRGFMYRTGARLERNPGEVARALQKLVAPLYPLVELHAWVYERLRFRRLGPALTAFLVTRTVYSGAGQVVFDGGPLVRLAQRPPFLRALSGIFLDGDQRPLFELREMFFRPWTALQRRRRLHLLIGDANLAEFAARLRVGATALVLEAIEEAPDEAWPCLGAPLDALREINRDPELRARLALLDGGTASAIEIQHAYLRATRRVLVPRLEPGSWKARLLADWEETLVLLERAPHELSDRIDWIAKRAEIERIAADPADRAALAQGGRALIAAGPPADPGERRLRSLAFRLLQADFRYHELSTRGGARRLEARGRLRRLTDPAAVKRARRQPPPDTRANARGLAIRFAHANALAGGAAWHRVRVGKLDWRFFPDPLDPGEQAGEHGDRRPGDLWRGPGAGP